MFLKSKKDKDDPDTSLPKTKTQTETVDQQKGVYDVKYIKSEI